VYWILIWNCLLWCWAMYSGKSYGCHLYGMKNRKVCVLDIDMELPSVMSSKVLCKYVDSICGVGYLSILCTFCIVVINNSHDTTSLLTPHSTELLKQLTGSQLVKTYPTYYGAWWFITTFITLHDTTTNINYNWTVHHKAATEILWVLIKKRFRTPDLIGGFSS